MIHIRSFDPTSVFLDGQPLFYVPKSVALKSIQHWNNDIDIQFPVSKKKETFVASSFNDDRSCVNEELLVLQQRHIK